MREALSIIATQTTSPYRLSGFSPDLEEMICRAFGPSLWISALTLLELSVSIREARLFCTC